mmetsp:Transcript_15369/g.40631  ORF Transcript_15369/g.40631 Transcript_15369/m.40631 type:complete len:429 (+) Transcript_15369:206-1492(+)
MSWRTWWGNRGSPTGLAIATQDSIAVRKSSMRSGRKTAAGERRKSSVQMVVDFVVGADASTRKGSTTMARRKSSRSGSVIFPSTSIGRKMSGLGASLTRRGSKEVVPDDTPQPPRNRRSSEQSMSLCHALYAYPMVPRLLLLLPPKTAGFSVLREPAKWFDSPMRLHFICAHSFKKVPLYNGNNGFGANMTISGALVGAAQPNDEDGYLIENPKEWMQEIVYTIKLTLMVLDAAVAENLVGIKAAIESNDVAETDLLPFPVIPPDEGLITEHLVMMQYRTLISDLIQILNQLYKGEADTMVKMQAFDTYVNEVDVSNKIEVGKMRLTVDKAYVKLAEKMMALDPSLERLPMEKTGDGNNSEWIWNIHKADYEKACDERRLAEERAKYETTVKVGDEPQEGQSDAAVLAAKLAHLDRSENTQNRGCVIS